MQSLRVRTSSHNLNWQNTNSRLKGFLDRAIQIPLAQLWEVPQLRTRGKITRSTPNSKHSWSKRFRRMWTPIRSSRSITCSTQHTAWKRQIVSNRWKGLSRFRRRCFLGWPSQTPWTRPSLCASPKAIILGHTKASLPSKTTTLMGLWPPQLSRAVWVLPLSQMPTWSSLRVSSNLSTRQRFPW